jgi:hypothetical protein
MRTNAGMQSVGGIPNRTTVCAAVNPLGGGQDDFTNIQNAINTCPAGEVVQLGAGAFTIEQADVPIHIAQGLGNVGSTSCGAIALTADAAQGQTTISVTSTSQFSVGQWVLTDEASRAGWVTDPMGASNPYGSVTIESYAESVV